MSAQTIRVERPRDTIVEISGGAGPSWRLRYGTTAGATLTASAVAISDDRAYFVHGPWLRQIDTVNGRVLGRWRFPNVIREVVPSRFGPVLTVRFEREPGAREAIQSVLFDPTYGDTPTWSLATPLPYLVSEQEAWGLLKDVSPSLEAWGAAMTGAAAALPALEDLARRDPTAPWIRLALGKALSDAGDPRARAVFAEAAAIESTDFTELFRIAGTLELLPAPEPQLASAAYERAYTDFVRHFRDPRLMTSLASLLILYPPGPARAPGGVGGERIEHVFRLAPVVAGADRAWARVAGYWEAQGNADAARIWRERAATARRETLALAGVDVLLVHDRALLVAIGAIVAALLLMAAIIRRYAPQRRIDRGLDAGGRRGAWMPLAALTYASRRERGALLAAAAAGWVSIGLVSQYSRAIEPATPEPLHVGEIGGPDDIEFFRDRLPASAERDLLVAIAYHTAGDLTEAERRYRNLPQFAVSWNNLGVVLSRTRRADEAQQAFGRALEIAPDLAEAILNTDGLPRSLETELHQKYAPVRKMIAVPDREVVLRAFLDRDWTGRYRLALWGPLRDLRRGPVDLRPARVAAIPALRPIVLLIALGAAVLAIVPRRPAPSAAATPFDYVAPGLSPSWNWAAGPVLVLWCLLVTMLVLDAALGSPYVTTWRLQPDLVGTFGLLPASAAGLEGIDAPSATIGAFALLLWLANWAVVRRARR